MQRHVWWCSCQIASFLTISPWEGVEGILLDHISKAKTVEWVTKGDIEKTNCFLALLLLAMPAIRALALLVFSFIDSIPDFACQLGLSAQDYPQADSPDHVDYQNYRCLHSASCPSP